MSTRAKEAAAYMYICSAALGETLDCTPNHYAISKYEY
jgi:hypothetical protein